MASDEMIKSSEVRQSIVMKLPIQKFGKKSKSIQEIYPDAKLLVFCSEPWKVTGMKAVGLNENILYVLAKHDQDYVIVAEKRLGELNMRTGKPFKKLLSFNGDALDELEVHNPITNEMIPVVINNEVKSEYGSGIDCVSPAHDLESLNVAYHYGLDKSGYVTEAGVFDDQLGPKYQGASIFEEETNQIVSKMIKDDGQLFCQYSYKNEFFIDEKTQEKIILRS
jgi:isoleucyl-tRNA synthetase